MTVPRLSIIVLNYNYAHYLPECLGSILEQTYRDFELVVIDDCSKDDSLSVVQPFLQDPRVRLFQNPKNLGFAGSLISGTETHTRGELVAVISADDRARRPDAFATQIQLLDAHPSAAFCFSGIDLLRGQNLIGTHQSFPNEVVLDSRDALHALLAQRGVWPLHSGTIVRRSAYEACGGYRRDLRMALDLGLWHALAMQGGFAYSPLCLYGYRLHDGQMSAALASLRRNAREVVRIMRDSCAEGERRGFDTARLCRAAIGGHFADSALAEAFAGDRTLAGRRWLAAALESPIETAISRRLWIVALRLAAGEYATNKVRDLARLLKRSR